ncbi:MAG TPA: tetratricopeptide repeat protein, partial [Blastocatellia bacterium]|nr:tetratricopeptide repeat protein [Blastocatellia bacterium]
LKGAKAAIDEALRLGTRDALLHYHAGMIYAKLGDQSSAIKHLSRALQINPSFDVLQADAARQKLEELQTRKQ